MCVVCVYVSALNKVITHAVHPLLYIYMTIYPSFDESRTLHREEKPNIQFIMKLNADLYIIMLNHKLLLQKEMLNCLFPAHPEHKG